MGSQWEGVVKLPEGWKVHLVKRVGVWKSVLGSKHQRP